MKTVRAKVWPKMEKYVGAEIMTAIRRKVNEQ